MRLQSGFLIGKGARYDSVVVLQRHVSIGYVTGQQQQAFPADDLPLGVTEDQEEDGGSHGHVGVAEEVGSTGDGHDQGGTSQYKENVENAAADHIAHGQVPVSP